MIDDNGSAIREDSLYFLPLSTILDSLRALMWDMNDDVSSIYPGLLLRRDSSEEIASITVESIESVCAHHVNS